MKSPFISTLVNSLSLGRIKYGWYSMPYVSEATPIFAGGCSRSGTTLLYSLLNSHSRVSLGLETGLLTGMHNIDGLAHRTKLPREQLQRLYQQSRCYSEFTEHVLQALADRDAKPRWGDKSPTNVTVLDALFEHFPNAKFIHAIRDGRDVVCSLRTYPPSFGNRYETNPWSLCVERWNTWTRLGMRFRGDRRYFEIKYEDMTSEPEKTLRTLFEWLEEPWEPAILQQSRLTRVSSHPELSQPINKTRTGRWIRDMSRDARELFRGEANDLLVALGYAPDAGWIEDAE